MRIVFFPVDCCPFHGKTLEERPLGGTETAVIRLAEALENLGQDVTVLSQFPAVPETRPAYIPVARAQNLGKIDILIVVRGWLGLTVPFDYKRCFFWTGDAYDNVHTFGLGDRRLIQRLDGFLAVSQWHADTMCRSSGFPREKTLVLRNGINLADFQGAEKRAKRLIYSSSPLRGLNYLPEIFLELKTRHDELELYVFSSTTTYRPEWPPVTSNAYDGEVLRKLPGCHLLESIPQKCLAREFMKSSILAYPTNFEESSCITAMEAQAGGCVPVTTALAALPETVGDGGVLIEGKAGTRTYFENYVEACHRLLSDPGYFQKLSQRGIERARHFGWQERAVELLDYLRGQ